MEKDKDQNHDNEEFWYYFDNSYNYLNYVNEISKNNIIKRMIN